MIVQQKSPGRSRGSRDRLRCEQQARCTRVQPVPQNIAGINRPRSRRLQGNRVRCETVDWGGRNQHAPRALTKDPPQLITPPPVQMWPVKLGAAAGRARLRPNYSLSPPGATRKTIRLLGTSRQCGRWFCMEWKLATVAVIQLLFALIALRRTDQHERSRLSSISTAKSARRIDQLG